MKNLFRLVKYARPYWGVLVISGISLLLITGLNLLAPWLIKELVGILTGNFYKHLKQPDLSDKGH